MSKKDKVQNSINIWHSHLNKTISVMIALCAFAFSSAGGVIEAPLWLIISSVLGLVVSGVAVIYIQKRLTKLIKEIGDLK